MRGGGETHFALPSVALLQLAINNICVEVSKCTNRGGETHQEVEPGFETIRRTPALEPQSACR